MLAQPDLIPICAGAGDFSVGRDDFVRAADSARVYASDRSVGSRPAASANIVARDRARVRARDRVTIDSDDSAVVIAGFHALRAAAG